MTNLLILSKSCYRETAGLQKAALIALTGLKTGHYI